MVNRCHMAAIDHLLRWAAGDLRARPGKWQRRRAIILRLVASVFESVVLSARTAVHNMPESYARPEPSLSVSAERPVSPRKIIGREGIVATPGGPRGEVRCGPDRVSRLLLAGVSRLSGRR
jgi:hypothetical protein